MSLAKKQFNLTLLIQRFLYTLLFYGLTPIFFLRLLVKHQKSNTYKEQRQSLRLAERLGVFSAPQWIKPESLNNDEQYEPKSIWFHTVSVGEFIAALPLIRQIMEKYPQYPLVITCTTTTGSAQIMNTLDFEIQQGKIFHVYLPYDLPGSMRRFFKKTQPCLGIIMETEIWPNLLESAERMVIPVYLLNARMSERSEQGYQRFKCLTQKALQQFTGIAAQDVLDAERLKNLGAREDTLTITGSIKFDIQVNPDDIRAGKLLRQQLRWQDNKVLIAASTHKGEDEILLNVYQKLKQHHPQLVMIVVPRHPERFSSVYQLLTMNNNKVIKRSSMNDRAIDEDKKVELLLGDSMGEMMRYFACADIVFMGGTLVPTGGHNILEPAAIGLPIVYGPHVFNFNAISELFLSYQAAIQIADETSLEQLMKSLISDPQVATIMAAKARQLIEQNAGAMDKMMRLIESCLNLR